MRSGLWRALALPWLAGLSSPAWAETLAHGSAPGVPWLRLVLSLAFCLALAWGAVLVLRRYQRRETVNPFAGLLDRKGAPQRRLAILESRRASVHGDLCLVECDGETFLLAITPAGATLLKGPGTAGPAR